MRQMSPHWLLVSQSSDDRGFSLVEVMITITLVGLTMGAVYSLYVFGANSFTRGEEQVLLQQDVRRAAEIISDTIRYARSIEILEAAPDGEGEDLALIYAEGNKIVRSEKGRQIVIAGQGEQAAEFSLVFKASGTTDRQVDFTVSGSAGEREYAITSSVLGLNIENGLSAAMGSVLGYEGVE